MKTICVILAGGRSRRMGRDKAALPLGAGTFLSRLVREYAPEFPVYVSVGERGKFPLFGAGELVDLHPGQGPLAGLEAAFRETDAEGVFLTATDLPFGTRALARRLVENLGTADACVIRRRDGTPEPTFAVYRRSCLAAVEQCLREGRRSFRGMFDRMEVQWVPEETLGDVFLERVLQNVNTPEEYEAAQAAWKERESCCKVTTHRM